MAIFIVVLTALLTVWQGPSAGIVAMWVGILIVFPGSYLVTHFLAREMELGALSVMVQIYTAGAAVYVFGLIVLIAHIFHL